MRRTTTLVSLTLVALALARPALAQRFDFERTYDIAGPAVLDVSTVRGAITVVAGAPGRVVVAGDATVRVGWNVPANAVELARAVAGKPPVAERDGTVTAQPPAGEESRRAVTISYRIEVPPDTRVVTLSESGATSVKGAGGTVQVRTQSGAIDLADLGGSVTISTGSGAVTLDGAAGDVRVTTSSSGFTGRALAGGLHLRTSSGAVDVGMAGGGDVDVETGSSAIQLDRLAGGLVVETHSGRVTASGSPARPWTVRSGSGAVVLKLPGGASLNLEASSGSGDVRVDGAELSGRTSKGKAAGTIGGGGPLVRATSRSGSVKVQVGAASLRP
jgi:hypothetical protein